MEAWIRAHHDLGDHPKVYRLAEALKIDQYAAVGLVVCLWIWTVTYAPDEWRDQVDELKGELMEEKA